MDLGFTAGSRVVFQLYIDDYTRESFIDILNSKTEVLPRWVELKGHLENDHQPWKFAAIKTDMEPIYWTPAWEQHCKAHNLEHELVLTNTDSWGWLNAPCRPLEPLFVQ